MNRQEHTVNRREHKVNRKEHQVNRQEHTVNRQEHMVNRKEHKVNRQDLRCCFFGSERGTHLVNAGLLLLQRTRDKAFDQAQVGTLILGKNLDNN